MTSEQQDIVLLDIRRRGFLYTVEFSNDYQVRVTKAVIEHLQLRPGMFYDEKEFTSLKGILDKAFAVYTAESILARRAHSIAEFKAKLRLKEIDGGLIAGIVKDFRKLGLLDDYEYGRMRVQSLVRRKPAGRSYYLADLQRKQVPREIAERVVQDMLGDLDEVAAAVRLLEKRRSSFVKFDLETARQKAYTYLSRRAISFGVAREAFDKVFDRNDFERGEQPF